MLFTGRSITFSPHALALVVSLAVLSGCTLGPDFTVPESEITQTATEARSDYGYAEQATQPTLDWQWWAVFNDPILTQLQAKAQTGNIDLQIATSRIAQSRAALGITAADQQPRLSANASYAREGNSENGKMVALGAPSEAENYWTAGFDASWELDLWGRAQRATEEVNAKLDASLYQREAMHVSLAAEVAKAYLQLRNAQTQLAISLDKQQTAEQIVALMQSREDNGVGTHFDTIRAQTDLATLTASLPELTMRSNQLMNALALLLGEQPRALDALLATSNKPIQLPAGVPVEIPSDLALRRPDILEAQANLHAAVAAIGVAEADFYPRVTLSGSLGLEAFDSNDLLSWDSRSFSVGPKVYLPIFSGGKLTQQLELTKEKQKSSALSYRKTVLAAWHEVDNAIDAWRAQQSQQHKLSIAHQYTEQAMKMIERNYQQGTSDHLAVLQQKGQVLNSQIQLNNSTTQAEMAVVSLYKTLGGGWDNSQPVTEKSAMLITTLGEVK
jgi:NodT family efflux transporter outer membrane factor (OMF) lipoprotein